MSTPMAAAPARFRPTTSRASTARSQGPAPNRASLAGSRATTRRAGLAGGLAQCGGPADEHRDRLAHAPFPEQGAADRVVSVRREAWEVPPERRAIVPKRLLDVRAIRGCAPVPPQGDLSELRERLVGLRHALLGGPKPPRDGGRQIALDPEAGGVRRTREVLRARVSRLRGGEKFGRGLSIALREPQHEREVVARILVVRIAREDTTERLDRPVEVALRVSDDAQAVVRLAEVGSRSEDVLELDARRRPVLLRHERARQGEPSREGIGLPSEGRAQLLDGGVEVAHAVEGEPEARAGLDQVGLTPECLA